MEVHHAHTERKKWYHYLWEFFMLFLAVTLGFFVENQREHFIEHKRENQYMQSMVEDLKTDIHLVDHPLALAWMLLPICATKYIDPIEKL